MTRNGALSDKPCYLRITADGDASAGSGSRSPTAAR
jgi:hypothetical protein